MSKNILGKRIGVLGGGQLARMLALRAHQLGLEVHILSERASDPAAQVVRFWHQGHIEKQKDIEKFLNSVDIATFESEFLEVSVLREISLNYRYKIWPSPKSMIQLQDRLTQKELFNKYQLPTSPFLRVSDVKELQLAREYLGTKFVLKRRHGGYDGYGTFIVSSEEDLELLKLQFKEESQKKKLGKVKKANDFVGKGFIAEKFIAFKRELALMAIRSRSGKTIFLPLVQTHQTQSRCDWIKGPIEHSKVKLLQKQLIKFLSGINYVGAMGIEIFETAKGNFIVNEIAPRVHNSGHYSWNALSEDQFILHLKAIFGIEISKPKGLFSGFAMANLLGNINEKGTYLDEFSLKEGVFLHWYGKQDERKGRKMGHVNSIDSSCDKALKQVLSWRNKYWTRD